MLINTYETYGIHQELLQEDKGTCCQQITQLSFVKIQESWDDIPQDTINQCISSMPPRVLLLIIIIITALDVHKEEKMIQFSYNQHQFMLAQLPPVNNAYKKEIEDFVAKKDFHLLRLYQKYFNTICLLCKVIYLRVSKTSYLIINSHDIISSEAYIIRRNVWIIF